MAERIGRRAFLRRGALLAAALPLLGAAAACDRRGPMATGTVPEGSAFGPLPVDQGLTLASGLPIERGATLKVYEWKDYLSSRVLASFEHAYADHDVHVQVESFTRIDEAIQRLQEPSADFDVVFPVIDVLEGMVAQNLLRPLNHDYLPHLSNLWGWFRNGSGPFYDPGQRYTTPYTIYTGGIGWRADMVRAADAPDARSDPYAIFTDARYRNLVGIYDAYRDAIALGLQQAGVQDLTAATSDQLTAAGNFLADAVAQTDARFTDDGAEEGLPEKTFAVHQAWSGDILTAPRYAAEGGDNPNEVAAALRYWSPSEPARVVGLDLTAICAKAATPWRRTRSSIICCGSTSRSTTSRGTAIRCRWRVRRAKRSQIRRSGGTPRCRRTSVMRSCRRRSSREDRCWSGSGRRRTLPGSLSGAGSFPPEPSRRSAVAFPRAPAPTASAYRTR